MIQVHYIYYAAGGALVVMQAIGSGWYLSLTVWLALNGPWTGTSPVLGLGTPVLHYVVPSSTLLSCASMLLLKCSPFSLLCLRKVGHWREGVHIHATFPISWPLYSSLPDQTSQKLSKSGPFSVRGSPMFPKNEPTIQSSQPKIFSIHQSQYPAVADHLTLKWLSMSISFLPWTLS